MSHHHIIAPVSQDPYVGLQALQNYSATGALITASTTVPHGQISLVA